MSETTTTTTARRGRPRPDATVQRDEKVFAQLTAGPKTKAELATAAGLSPAETYLSLYRLRASGRATRQREGGAHKWTVTAPAPTQAAPPAAA